MELIINPGRTKKLKLQFVIYITLISFLVSLVNIYHTSLLFVLPLFYLCFMCGYRALLSYGVGLLIGIIFLKVPYELLVISLFSFVLLEFCLLFQSMRSRYVPYMLTLIGGIYYAYIQIDLLSTLLLTILTYFNIIIFSYLAPLFMHGESELLTHERVKSLSVVIFICLMSVLPYSQLVTMVFIRVFILVMVYHECLDDLLPGLFYGSMLMLLMDLGYKDDILTFLLPLFFFYMVKCESKFTMTALYFLSHLILPFFVDFSYTYHGLIVAVSGLIFLALPIHKTKTLLSSSYQEMTMKQQLSKQVDSFCRLFEQMTSLFTLSPTHNHSLEYIGYVYEDMCYNCSSQETCFNKKYGPNRLVKLMNKGLKETYDTKDEDFIYQYCLKPEQYLETMNTYQKDYRKISRIQQEYSTMKKDLYHQFSLLNDVFHQFSSQLKVGHIEESHIYEHMEGYHFQIAHLKKYYESQSVYYIEIGLYETTKEEIENEFVPILQDYLNETLDIEVMRTPMHQLGYTYLVLKHHARYYVQYGISQCSKDSVACGDSYTVFAMDENQYFGLSDGMGQGQKASEDSSLTLDVMKQLIVNGISLKDTIQSVNALLKIKNRNDMFTTVDMIQVNLVGGNTTMIKYGACPTYILRDKEVIEIKSESLPMGIISPIETSVEKFQLMENDIVFMVTDGFTNQFGEFLDNNKYLIDEDHPKEIAHLLTHLANDEQKNDDMTLIVLKLCKQ
ncbi:PP2C family serine/threonine-protein phosphatase [Candidatus Stoquefichus massiliensis]|uniref:PP2C family serine/threonine-protein phosphatase n=1 Tax=Candidatus Stoquefichus massiliensis TaxID=1470350 RepID=UPI000487ADF8|nr:PP2C family serine/threonine-protein phosphatase [Candidatus Stoquefichus massiliensis]